MLTVAVPARGVVADRAEWLLAALGHGGGAAGSAGTADVRVYRLPERDLAVHIVLGGLHLALCGSLAAAEASPAPSVVLDLGPSGHDLELVATPDTAASEEDLVGTTVATPYPTLVRRYFADRRIAVRRVVASELVEHAVELGVADAVAALVPTGDPRPPSAGMRRLATVASSRLVVVEADGVDDERSIAVRRRLLRELAAVACADEVARPRLPGPLLLPGPRHELGSRLGHPLGNRGP